MPVQNILYFMPRFIFLDICSSSSALLIMVFSHLVESALGGVSHLLLCSWILSEILHFFLQCNQWWVALNLLIQEGSRATSPSSSLDTQWREGCWSSLPQEGLGNSCSKKAIRQTAQSSMWATPREKVEFHCSYSNNCSDQFDPLLFVLAVMVLFPCLTPAFMVCVVQSLLGGFQDQSHKPKSKHDKTSCLESLFSLKSFWG